MTPIYVFLDQDEIREFAARQFLPERYQVTSSMKGIAEYCPSYRKDLLFHWVFMHIKTCIYCKRFVAQLF